MYQIIHLITQVIFNETRLRNIEQITILKPRTDMLTRENETYKTTVARSCPKSVRYKRGTKFKRYM